MPEACRRRPLRRRVSRLARRRAGDVARADYPDPAGLRVDGRDVVDDDPPAADGDHDLRIGGGSPAGCLYGRLPLGSVVLPDEDAPVAGRQAHGEDPFPRGDAANPLTTEDRARQVRGAAASQEVAGLAEVGGRDSQLACLRLVEAELAELLGAPPEDVNLLIEKRRLLRGCGALDTAISRTLGEAVWVSCPELLTTPLQRPASGARRPLPGRSSRGPGAQAEEPAGGSPVAWASVRECH